MNRKNAMLISYTILLFAFGLYFQKREFLAMIAGAAAAVFPVLAGSHYRKPSAYLYLCLFAAFFSLVVHRDPVLLVLWACAVTEAWFGEAMIEKAEPEDLAALKKMTLCVLFAMAFAALFCSMLRIGFGGFARIFLPGFAALLMPKGLQLLSLHARRQEKTNTSPVVGG